MTNNAIPRDRLRAGVVDCPLCGRQSPEPTEHLVTFGVESATPGTADAVECTACGGASFLQPRSRRDG